MMEATNWLMWNDCSGLAQRSIIRESSSAPRPLCLTSSTNPMFPRMRFSRSHAPISSEFTFPPSAAFPETKNSRSPSGSRDGAVLPVSSALEVLAAGARSFDACGCPLATAGSPDLRATIPSSHSK